MRERNRDSFVDILKEGYTVAKGISLREWLEVWISTEELKMKMLSAEVFHPVATFKAVTATKEDERQRYAAQAFSGPTFPPLVEKILDSISEELTLANAISVSRPALVIAANMAGLDNPLEYTGLMATAFATDALDGWVARKLGPSPLGGHVDLTADHSASALMYIYLAGSGIIPVWVPIVTIGRDITTDVLRMSHFLLDTSLTGPSSLTPGDQPLNILSQSRPIRTAYAGLKAAVGLTAPFSAPAAEFLSEASAAICLIRGIPVIFNPENKKITSALKKTIPKK